MLYSISNITQIFILKKFYLTTVKSMIFLFYYLIQISSVLKRLTKNPTSAITAITINILF